MIHRVQTCLTFRWCHSSCNYALKYMSVTLLNRLFEVPECHGDSIVTVMNIEQICYFHENGGASEDLESKVPALFLACHY